MASRLLWDVAALKQRVGAAQKAAIDETTAACVAPAMSQLYKGHGLITGTLQGSIQAKGAERDAKGWVGRWGSFDVNYALYIELRYGYLRHGADQEYPKLPARIKARLR